MSRFSEQLSRRWSGLWIMRGSLTLGVGGILPLLLYSLVGPEDGNPIGLGLLAMAAVLIALLGLAIGLIKMIIDLIRQPGR